jgi:pimeloyl-ACP methyl ester carboxylesterase
MSQTFVERRWSSADGLSLAARDYAAASGTAKLPVIAIHGLTRNSADFDAIAPLIAQSGRRVLAVDIRGRGQSDRAPDPMTYQPVTYAQDVLALMRDLGIERAVFLGTSMGGLISDYIGSQRPDRFGAVGIFSPAYWAGTNHANRSITNQPVRRYLYMGTAESSGAAQWCTW